VKILAIKTRVSPEILIWSVGGRGGKCGRGGRQPKSGLTMGGDTDLLTGHIKGLKPEPCESQSEGVGSCFSQGEARIWPGKESP